MAHLVIGKHKDIWDILKVSAWGGQGGGYWTECDDEIQRETQSEGLDHLGLQQEFKCGGGVEEVVHQAEQNVH